MSFLLNLSYTNRPQRLEGISLDKEYHNNTARYFWGLGTNNTLHQQWLDRTERNRDYRIGDQWREGSNSIAFLTDSSNNETGRIKWTVNYVYRIAQAFISKSEAMDLTFKAENISPNALTRKEEQKEFLKYMNYAYDSAAPNIQKYISETFPIGMNEQQTGEIFDISYSDKVARDVNLLLNYVKNEQNLDFHKAQLGVDLFDSGLCGLQAKLHYSQIEFERIIPDRIVLDRRAKMSDLSDSEYMGYWSDYDATNIFEDYPNMNMSEMKALETYCATGNSNNFSNETSNSFIANNRVPVARMYWKDLDISTWAYVYDEQGFPVLRKINYIFEGEEKERYTEKDIIPIKNLNVTQKKTLKGSDRVKLYLDIIRFCDFVPFEYVPVYYGDNNNKDSKAYDIILDYGVYSYQETELYNVRNCRFPIKLATWIYANGDIDTPCSYLIDPQDLINRYESIREQKMSHIPIGGLTYDKDMLDGQDGCDEAGLIKAMNMGEPFGLSARRTGMNNAVNYVQPNYQGVAALFEIGNNLKMKMQEVVGVNDSFLASTQGQDKLVGTSALEIQQSTNLQFPFFNAISHIYEQCYEAIANPYRKMLAQNEHKIVAIMGNSKAIELSFLKEHNIESIRVFIKKDLNIEELHKQADNEMMQFLQLGLQPETFASLLHRSTPTEVQQALYRDIMTLKLAQQNAAAQKAQQSNGAIETTLKAGIAEQNDAELSRDQSTHNLNVKANADMNKQIVKSAADIAGRKMDIESRNVDNAGGIETPPPEPE